MNTNVASKGGVGFALVTLLAAASVVLTSLTGIFYKTFLLENIGEYQLISLKDAKELLKMGYVFAGPQCLCFYEQSRNLK